VEIMIVLAVVGLLNAIAIPAIRNAQRQAIAASIANEWRRYRDGFCVHAVGNGGWAEDAMRQKLPDDLRTYIGTAHFETDANLFGGVWDWEGIGSPYQEKGIFTAGLSMKQYSVDEDMFRRVDRILDDGDLATGDFRRSVAYGRSVTWVFEW